MGGVFSSGGLRVRAKATATLLTLLSAAMGLVKTVANRKDGAQEQARRTKTSPADVVRFSPLRFPSHAYPGLLTPTLAF